ncbi:hypothetical protein [Aeromonas media]|uniref:hypothetical protein n=1 Tax=Aeromonas media TaxID=651 RepID=UPI003851247D
MATRALSKSTTALLLLDYCAIKDAAKLLNCKVNNILQLASEGKITLMVNFDEWDAPAYGNVTDHTGQAPDCKGNIKLSRGRAWYGDIAVTEHEGVVSAKLGGIWSVPPAWVYGSQIKKPSSLLMVFASPDILTTSNSIEAIAEIHGVDIPYPPYLISKENLLILKQCMESEQVLPRNTDPLHPANNSQNDISYNELLAQSIDLAKQLQQARDEIASLKANTLVFRHQTKALEFVAEVQNRYWGNNWIPSDQSTTQGQEDIIQYLKDKHGLSHARARAIAQVASPIDTTTSEWAK